MEWFDGGVLNAITTCRQIKALFIVYVYDESDASSATSEALNNEEVIQVLKDNSYVALKVSKDSVELNQFSQIFPVFVFPSVYCISLAGKPLVVMSGQQTGEKLKNKLSEAFLKMKEQQLIASTSTESSSTSAVAAQKTTVTATNSSVSPIPVQSSESSTIKPSGATPESKEEKLKRYEKKILERRAEKQEADRQLEKRKENERRKQGKDITRFRQAQIEERNKNWLKERQKQKADALLAREEIRAKIEQDKRERLDKEHTASLHQKDTSSSTNRSINSSSGVSRLQLRLPMGSVKVIEVNNSDTLYILKQKICEVLDLSPAVISLKSVYPHRELTSSMDSQSMVELELAPAGVVIVKIKKSSSTPYPNANVFWTTVMSFFNFIIWIFGIVYKFVVGLFSSSKPTTDHESLQTDSVPGRESRVNNGRVQKFRSEDYQDDSDDMGTYNGNSTQQQ